MSVLENASLFLVDAIQFIFVEVIVIHVVTDFMEQAPHKYVKFNAWALALYACHKVTIVFVTTSEVKLVHYGIDAVKVAEFSAVNGSAPKLGSEVIDNFIDFL
jgi:hypothetical protein